MSSVDINCLPNELLEYILSQTSPYCDFKSALLVCKRWYDVTKDVIRRYRHHFYKALCGESDLKLVWSSHSREAGPTVTERYSHSACYCNKSVYIFGGCTSTSTTFNDLWRFDLEHRKWVRPLATGTYPSPKACASLVAYKDSLILFGGWSHPTPYTFHQASRFFNQLHLYNPECNRWTQIVTVDSPEGIAGHGASIVNDTMVVFGGYHGHGASNSVVWVLDLIQMIWSKKSTTEPKPLPRYSHTQVCLDRQRILILGGCGGPNMQFSDAWILDMSCDPWRWLELTVCRPDLAAQHLWCHPGCQVGSKLVVLGKNNAKIKEAAMFSRVTPNVRLTNPAAKSEAVSMSSELPPSSASVRLLQSQSVNPPATVRPPHSSASVSSLSQPVAVSMSSELTLASVSVSSSPLPAASSVNWKPILASSSSSSMLQPTAALSNLEPPHFMPESLESPAAAISVVSISTPADVTMPSGPFSKDGQSSFACTAISNSDLPSDVVVTNKKPHISVECLAANVVQALVAGNQSLDCSLSDHTSGARIGMPSVRPNAMNDRRRRHEVLNKHEDKIRQSASRARTQSLSVMPTYRRLSVAPVMSVHVLDTSEAVELGRVTWLPIQGNELAGAPDEAIFYSLVEGRGELMMFGGIRGDAKSLHRGSTTTQHNIVLNNVHLLSFYGDRIC